MKWNYSTKEKFKAVNDNWETNKGREVKAVEQLQVGTAWQQVKIIKLVLKIEKLTGVDEIMKQHEI